MIRIIVLDQPYLLYPNPFLLPIGLATVVTVLVRWLGVEDAFDLSRRRTRLERLQIQAFHPLRRLLGVPGYDGMRIEWPSDTMSY